MSWPSLEVKQPEVDDFEPRSRPILQLGNHLLMVETAKKTLWWEMIKSSV